MQIHDNPSTTVVLLTRNPGKFWEDWVTALRSQTLGMPNVLVMDSASSDKTNFSLIGNNGKVVSVDPELFNHGGTRNESLKHLSASTEFVVFMTQDSLMADSRALENLLDSFIDTRVACCFGRQLPHKDSTPIAAHARLFNYGPDSRTTFLSDRREIGFKACFLSNSFAAYRLSALKEVNGFPESVVLGEDTYVAARLLHLGWGVRYQASAVVYHSHNYTPWEEFRRYFDTGVFHARSPWLLEAFGGATGEGKRFVVSEIRNLLLRAPWLIPSALIRTGLKLMGYRLGRIERFLPLMIKRRFSMFRNYWAHEADRHKDADTPARK